jgi:NAD(P)-dependent dehydrogenase (short-subunit alcohol dehydrogenase family)
VIFVIYTIADEQAVKTPIEWVISAYPNIDVLANIAFIETNHPTELYHKIISIDRSYYMSKHAVIGLGKTVAKEVGSGGCK